MRSWSRGWRCPLIVVLWAFPACAQQQPGAVDLADKSIEDLMNIEVTSASKRAQKISEVAAAIFVISQEDIRRSGAMNIPDLLRMVPGMDVAQINADTWAISARGFNLQFADKLLVLIDGRAVYTPLFGGVNWDTVDVPLEDIERIEVIRGPGGSVWGANAMNGVINIITKGSADTLGGLATAGGGSQAQEFGTMQYGGHVGNSTTYRVFTKYFNYDHSPDLNGQDAYDGWHLLHGGFRADTTLSQKDSLTTQGDLYAGDEGSTIVHSTLFPPDNIIVPRITELSGGNILSRWNHSFSSRSSTTLQIYFDRYTRNGPESNEVRNTVDLDFQQHLLIGARHDLIWGLGYRHTADTTEGTIDQAFVPADESRGLFTSFVQDQITLRPGRLLLYVGTKLENSYFTGFDLLPSIRLAWTPSSRATFWGAISRASRTPTQRDIGLAAVLAALPGPSEVVLFGNPNEQPEHVIAYEWGYRAQATERVSLDITAFVNDYHGLESDETLSPFLDSSSGFPVLILPQSFANKLHGITQGIEASVNWKIAEHWTISPGYSFLEMHLHTDADSLDTVSAADEEGSNPGNQVQLRSRLEPFQNWTWDVNAYFVGSLPAQSVDSYTRVDTQLAWRPAESWDISLVGQNLLSNQHVEFNDFLQSLNSSQVKRSAYGKVTWHF